MVAMDRPARVRNASTKKQKQMAALAKLKAAKSGSKPTQAFEVSGGFCVLLLSLCLCAFCLGVSCLFL